MTAVMFRYITARLIRVRSILRPLDIEIALESRQTTQT